MYKSALEFKDLRFSYTSNPFINGLDLSISAGQVTGIVGPNGCGKSTLMKLAVGLLHPQAGNIHVDGVSLRTLSAKKRARSLALLPQSLPATPMSVEALVSSGRFAHQKPLAPLSDADRSIVAQALSMTGLDRLADHTVGRLSGGQRQRAYLAMILAQEANVLLLDEPTSSLDVGASHEILKLIRDIANRSGKTVCMVIHDLDLALRYCDKIVVLQSGSVRCQGTPYEIAERGTLENVFGVSMVRHDTPQGSAWSFFPCS